MKIKKRKRLTKKEILEKFRKSGMNIEAMLRGMGITPTCPAWMRKEKRLHREVFISR